MICYIWTDVDHALFSLWSWSDYCFRTAFQRLRLPTPSKEYGAVHTDTAFGKNCSHLHRWWYQLEVEIWSCMFMNPKNQRDVIHWNRTVTESVITSSWVQTERNITQKRKQKEKVFRTWCFFFLTWSTDRNELARTVLWRRVFIWGCSYVEVISASIKTAYGLTLLERCKGRPQVIPIAWFSVCIRTLSQWRTNSVTLSV